MADGSRLVRRIAKGKYSADYGKIEPAAFIESDLSEPGLSVHEVTPEMRADRFKTLCSPEHSGYATPMGACEIDSEFVLGLGLDIIATPEEKPEFSDFHRELLPCPRDSEPENALELAKHATEIAMREGLARPAAKGSGFKLFANQPFSED